MNSIYKPNTSQLAQVYGVQPLQRYSINLVPNGSNQDFLQGRNIPEIEGQYLYVEHADYPCVMSYVNAATGERNSFVAKNGLAIRAPFKGLYLTYPNVNIGAAGQMPTLSIIVAKSVDGQMTNQLAAPFCGMWNAIRTITDAAALQVFDVYLPDGMRRVEKMDYTFLGTTLTDATWRCLTLGSNAFGSTPTDKFGNLYNASNPIAGSLDITTVGTGRFRLRDSGWMLPSYVDTLRVTLVGTGLGAANATYQTVFS